MDNVKAKNDDKVWSLFHAWELLGERAAIEPEAFEYAFERMDGVFRDYLVRYGLENDKQFFALVGELRA